MTHTLLIAEDNPDLLEVLSLHFDWHGYRVLKARDGVEVLARLDGKPDLLVLDVVMPHRNGYEVCRALKSDPALRRLPVVLLSGRRADADREWGLECGADVYLTKPFSISVLQGQVDALLSRCGEGTVNDSTAAAGESVLRWELDPPAARAYRQKYGELAYARLWRDLPATLLHCLQEGGICGRRTADEPGVIALALAAPGPSVEAWRERLQRAGDNLLRSLYDPDDVRSGNVGFKSSSPDRGELRAPLLRLLSRSVTEDEAGR